MVPVCEGLKVKTSTASQRLKLATIPFSHSKKDDLKTVAGGVMSADAKKLGDVPLSKMELKR
jgi:hypothetical protein